MDAPSPNAEVPTKVRYRVVSIAALGSVILYLDRVCMNPAAASIQADLNLTDTQIDLVLSAFFLTYALFQVPAGLLSDRLGTRTMYTMYFVAWSVITLSMGFATGFLSLLALRLLCGVAQAGAYPTSAALIKKWVPISARGAASGVVAFGGRIGGGLASYVTPLVIILCVPLTVNSLLDHDDLMDPARLEQALASAGADSPTSADSTPDATRQLAAQQLLRRLSADVQAQLAERAAKRRSDSDAKPADPEPTDPALTDPEPTDSQPTDSQPNDPEPIDPALIHALRNDLNRALAGPAIFDVSLIGQLTDLNDDYRKLLDQPDDLTEQQRERLNRVLLQRAFPKALRSVYAQGWRPLFLIYGAISLLVAFGFWWQVRDRPADHPSTNAAEVGLINLHQPAARPAAETQPRKFPWKPLLTSRSVWLLCIVQLCTNIGWVILITQSARFFEEVHNKPLSEQGLLITVPLLFGWPGMLLGGPLTDQCSRRFGLRWGRSLPIAGSRWLAMAAYLVMIFNLLVPAEPSVWVSVVMFSVVAFGTDLGTGAMWAFNQDVGGRYVASVLGWGNMWGNLGAMATPVLVGEITSRDDFGWPAALVVCALAFLISGVCALGVDASKPIDED